MQMIRVIVLIKSQFREIEKIIRRQQFVFNDFTINKFTLEYVLDYLRSCVNSQHSTLCFRRQIEESSKPKRQSQQIDKAVTTNYKPVANHLNNVSTLPYSVIQGTTQALKI